MARLLSLYLLLSFLCRPLALAGDTIEYLDHGGWDLSVTAGRFLPFGIVGVRDTYPMWGLAASHSTAVARFEYAYYNITGKGVKMHNGAISARIDYRMADTFDGYFSFGPNIYYYQRKRTASREFPYYTSGGGHFGFGGFWDISKSFALRVDFKMNFNPGRSLYAGAGFIYRFGPANESSTP